MELITLTGFKFSKSIDVAVTSPEPTLEQFVFFGLVGVYVGIIPVSLGLGWWPFLEQSKAEVDGFPPQFNYWFTRIFGIDALKEFSR